jgi:hypothetical protein
MCWIGRVVVAAAVVVGERTRERIGLPSTSGEPAERSREPNDDLAAVAVVVRLGNSVADTLPVSLSLDAAVEE